MNITAGIAGFALGMALSTNIQTAHAEHRIEQRLTHLEQQASPRLVPSRADRSRPLTALRPASPSPRVAAGILGAQRASTLNWSALARCESTNNPRAVSHFGTYRGLYQFDLSTWRSVGGTGDPIDASRAEQTLRAQLLYADRSREPWPQCGRLL